MTATEPSSLYRARADFFEICELLPDVSFQTFHDSYARTERLWAGGARLLDDVLDALSDNAYGGEACA